MQPRRIARELALLGVNQLPATAAKLNEKQLEDLLLAAVRALSEETHETLSTAAAEIQRSDRLLHESDPLLVVDTRDPDEVGGSRSPTDRLQQVQRQLKHLQTVLSKADAQSAQTLHSELLGLTHQAQVALSNASQSLDHLENRLNSIRHILDDVIQLAQGAINRVGAALSMPELLHIAQSPEVRAYALQLLTALQSHKEAIDARLQAALVGWQLQRLGRIERDILRLAVVEMEILASSPVRVTINEAVELAKKYGDPEAATFVNGVLRRVVDSRPEAHLSGDPSSPTAGSGG
ncbi:transcription antitermination factor NusB [Thermostichus vulcanus]|uniref:Transcription antitermination protein NusB n=1 Tax=Thermostichus vulcanus str. 'Rupite' TaxID=2813851 RepID=A0ABT0C7P9_THEVL|nr:transcription antitermination factor NusB [Thermostichus vulcanus]MCJ2541817.1 transcription antitermination protein NusB [Thermostichus vulcanus str. 'Rupite']